MRFRPPEIFLGAFLAVAVFAMGMLASSTLQPQRAEQQAATNQRTNDEGYSRHEAKSLWIPEDATGFFTLWIAAFTGILAISTIFLWRATRDAAIVGRAAADAALLNAEALVSAERAQLFVIVQSNNLHNVLMGARFYRDTESMHNSTIPRPELEFTIKNTGRTAAIMQDVSYQLIQADAETTFWEYAYQDTIVNAVIEGGNETSPPTPCIFESNLTLADGIAVIDGDRPIYFYGFIIFRDTFKRRYQYFWRYEYRSRRFVLVHEEEQQIETQDDAALSQPEIG
jgi:hypothetical protein